MTRRNLTIDAARGLAVFGMILPNMISLLEGTAPFPLRVYGSFAAPFFVMLAGMMVTLTSTTKQYPYSHYVRRAFLLLATGAAVDVAVNRYVPFLTMDILYLVGVSMLFLGACRKLPTAAIFILGAALLAAAPPLQHLLGYADYPNEFYVWGERTFVPASPTPVWHHWVVDGWFPLVPWLGLGFLGMGLGRLKRDWPFFAAGILLVGLGIAAWSQIPPPALVRGDYSEIFYPPTIPHLVVTLGALMTLLFAAEKTPELPAWRVFRPLGEAPLFFYVLHLTVISYVLRPGFGKLPLPSFLAVNLGFTACLIGVGFALRAYKERRETALPYGWRFLLGG